MKRKSCIMKIIVMMAVICLLGTNYGYWSEQLIVNGQASLLVQVSVVDLVKIETVTKEAKPIIKDIQSEDNSKELNEENIDININQEKDTSKDLLPDEPNDIEKIDLKDAKLKENNKNIIDEEFKDDTTLEEDKSNEVPEMDKELEEYNDMENLDIEDVIETDKDKEGGESNNILEVDVEVDGEELVEE